MRGAWHFVVFGTIRERGMACYPVLISLKNYPRITGINGEKCLWSAPGGMLSVRMPLFSIDFSSAAIQPLANRSKNLLRIKRFVNVSLRPGFNGFLGRSIGGISAGNENPHLWINLQ